VDAVRRHTKYKVYSFTETVSQPRAPMNIHRSFSTQVQGLIEVRPQLHIRLPAQMPNDV
jgi:hypothetical protein